MDRTALQKLDYGLYVLTAVDGGRGVGCVVSAVTPSAARPASLTNVRRETVFSMVHPLFCWYGLLRICGRGALGAALCGSGGGFGVPLRALALP